MYNPLVFCTREGKHETPVRHVLVFLELSRRRILDLDLPGIADRKRNCPATHRSLFVLVIVMDCIGILNYNPLITSGSMSPVKIPALYVNPLSNSTRML